MPNGLPMIKNNRIQIANNKNVYFVSDHHFGLDVQISSVQREELFVKWLDFVKEDADTIFILGDMFDFWYEYKQAVPKGFTRVLGKLAELTDAGISIHFFVGNHDMWMLDYFPKELNIPIYFKPTEFQINQHKFLLGHGDGLGPGDKKYKFLKKIFTNPVAQFLYRWIHPDIGLKMAKYLSQKNKLISGEYDQVFYGKDKEWLYLYAQNYLQKKHVDYFVFGHRHLPLELKINPNSTYYNTGDWLIHFSYIKFDGMLMTPSIFE